jgi:putative redox protein
MGANNQRLCQFMMKIHAAGPCRDVGYFIARHRPFYLLPPYIAIMKIRLERINDAVHLRAVNEDGNEVFMDGSPGIGGEGKGARPMQVLLMSLAGCSSMDVLNILKKMKQEVSSYHVEVDGEREADAVPNVFTGIHVIYHLEGEGLHPGKVKHAAQLSMEKYCSVTKMLEKTANITWEVMVNGKAV